MFQNKTMKKKEKKFGGWTGIRTHALRRAAAPNEAKRVAKMRAGQFLEGQYSRVFHQNFIEIHIDNSIFSASFKSVHKI